MNRIFATIVIGAAAGTVSAQSSTSFTGFSTGVSVNGQGGWSSTGGWDEQVVNFGGNNVWRVSNGVTSGSFGDMPFAPRPGGAPTNTVTDPVNSNPGNFAGESSTGATYTGAVMSFDFRSATGASQSGARITVSPDSGAGGRQGFASLTDNGTGGIQIDTFDVDSSGNFVLQSPLGTVNYTDWHNLRFEIDFIDGPDNDVQRIYLNNSLVFTGSSWEQYYSVNQPALHPLGVPVQTLLFRLSGAASSAAMGGGFYIDNVEVSLVPTPGAAALLGIGGLAAFRRRRSV